MTGPRRRFWRNRDAISDAETEQQQTEQTVTDRQPLLRKRHERRAQAATSKPATRKERRVASRVAGRSVESMDGELRRPPAGRC
jgi:hypothetical protein